MTALNWTRIAADMPDDEETVLIWADDDWCEGYHDGEMGWMNARRKPVLNVECWARVQGPK